MIRCLSFHSAYRCKDSGACCTAGWPIAIESDRVMPVRAALARGSLHARGAAPIREPNAVGAALLGLDGDGCVFYESDRRRCAMHHVLGHSALPLACRQFPRVSLRDPRGTSLTLSHFCPTAAALLDLDDPVSIVVNPAAFPADGEYVGLDATGVLPPLLRPGMLMDWDAWWEFERLAVNLVGNFVGIPAEAVGRLANAVAILQRWTPDWDEPLLDAVRASFAAAGDASAPLPPRDQLVADARTAIPAALRPTTLPSAPRPANRVVNRFLAAHAFGNWAVHAPGGLDAWLRSIATAHALIDSGFSVRDADLWLRHLAA